MCVCLVCYWLSRSACITFKYSIPFSIESLVLSRNGRKERIARIKAHQDDVNAVAYADQGSQVLHATLLVIIVVVIVVVL